MEANQLSRRRFLQLAGTGAASLALLAACQAPVAAPSGGEAPAAEGVTLTFGHHWEAAFR
ncbi:MAG: twin-arginine translocation signal domain-containing protein [Caldilinea sp.]|jgi:hypothetical protein